MLNQWNSDMADGIVKHVMMFHDVMDVGSLKAAEQIIRQALEQCEEDLMITANYTPDDGLDWYSLALRRAARRLLHAADLVDVQLNLYANYE